MRRLHVPAALRWLMVAVALVGTAWSLLVPAWHVPDEDAHFAYAQTLVELGRRPAEDGRPDEQAVKSTEQDLAERASRFLDSYQRVESKPAWSAEAFARWRRAEATLGEAARRDGGGANPAQGNPPGYYLYAAAPYLAASGGDVFDRLFLMRLLSVPLLLAFAASGWLLAGELLGRDRVLQLAAAAMCGLAPMATFIGSAVTPDALLMPLWGFVLWLSVRALRRGVDARAGVLLVGTTALALAVKQTSLALVPGVTWILVADWWRRRGHGEPSRRAVFGGLALGAAGAVAVAIVVVPGGLRRLASYLWQFYLPELPGQQHVMALPEWPLRDVWVEGATGAFGWLEVRFPWWIYALVAALAVLALGATGRAIGRRGPRSHAAVAVALATPAIALIAGIHLTEQRMLVEEGRGFAQGRYLLPLLPLAGVVVAAAISRLSAARRPTALAAVLGGLAALQLVALSVVTARFYA